MEPLGERAGTNFNPGMDQWLQTHSHTYKQTNTHTHTQTQRDQRMRVGERHNKQPHVGHFLVSHRAPK